MITFFICTAAMLGSQVANKSVPPAQIKCFFKLYDQRGLISAPKVLTLDDEKATISEETRGRTFQVSVLPHVNADSSVTTKLNISIDGAHALNSVLRSKSSEPSFIKVSKSKSGTIR